MSLISKTGGLYVKTKNGVQKVYPLSFPVAVQGLSAESTHNTITLKWNLLSRLVGQPLLGYRVRLNGVVIGDTNAFATSYTFSNLGESTSYDVAVAGFNVKGVGTYSTFTISTKAKPNVETPQEGNLLSTNEFDAGSSVAAFSTRGTAGGVTLESSTEWSSVGTSSIKATMTATRSASSGIRIARNIPVVGNAYYKATVTVRAGSIDRRPILIMQWLNSEGTILNTVRTYGTSIANGLFADISIEANSPSLATQLILGVQALTADQNSTLGGSFAVGSYFFVDGWKLEQTTAPAALTSSKVTSYEKPLAGLFGPTSEWMMDIRDAPINANSATLIDTLVTTDIEPNYNGIAVFNTHQFNSTTYVVTGDHPRINIGFCDAQRKGSTPGDLYAENNYKAFRDVPVPTDATSGGGGDGHIAIYCPDTDQLWEYWQFWEDRQQISNYGGVTPAAAKAGNFTYRASIPVSEWKGFSATWGGRIDNVSQAKGWFPGFTGTTATGLAMQGGNVGLAEVRAGKIEHALALSIVNPRKYTTYSYPARRSDGFVDSANNLPEGMRLRLDPTFNVATSSMHPIAKMIAIASQKYGMIIVDKSGGVEIEGESTQNYIRAGQTDPWTALMNGTPGYNILRLFPWSRMQALPFDYGKP